MKPLSSPYIQAIDIPVPIGIQECRAAAQHRSKIVAARPIQNDFLQQGAAQGINHENGGMLILSGLTGDEEDHPLGLPPC